jgi:membrane protein required for colicin V production
MEQFFDNLDERLEFFHGSISLLDTILIIYILINVITCVRKGFVASILSLMQYVVSFYAVILLLPIFRPYLDDFASEAMTDIILAPSIFIVALFIIFFVKKGIQKSMKWAGLGSVDKYFGLIFAPIRGSVLFISLFTIINIVVPSTNWPKILNKGFSHDIGIWGSEKLEGLFPDRYKGLKKQKEKLDDINNEKLIK